MYRVGELNIEWAGIKANLLFKAMKDLQNGELT